jgi:hypothetical protein
LARLREQAVLEQGQGEEADRLRRDSIKLLVAQIAVQEDGTPVVHYRFAESSDNSVHTSRANWPPQR